MRNGFLTVLLSLLFLSGYSQEIYPSVMGNSGYEFQLGNQFITFTVGELAVTDIQSSAYWYTQGFHQARYTVTPTGSLPPSLTVQPKVYPNPVEDIVYFEYNPGSPQKVQVELIDMLGRILKTETVEDAEIKVSFDLKQYSLGNYLIRARQGENTSLGNYKIQKVN